MRVDPVNFMLSIECQLYIDKLLNATNATDANNVGDLIKQNCGNWDEPLTWAAARWNESVPLFLSVCFLSSKVYLK